MRYLKATNLIRARPNSHRRIPLFSLALLFLQSTLVAGFEINQIPSGTHPARYIIEAKEQDGFVSAETVNSVLLEDSTASRSIHIWEKDRSDQPYIGAAFAKPLVGIIGGIGPAADVRFQELVLEKDRERRQPSTLCPGDSRAFLADASYTPYLLFHNPQIPNNNLAVLGLGPSSLNAMLETAQALQRAGADEVAFCCSTAYHWKAAVEEHVRVFDLPEQVANVVALKGYARVGLLDVDGTIRCGVFQQKMKTRGIELALPTEEDQLLLMSAVASLKSRGFSNNKESVNNLHRVAVNLANKEKVSAVILGCTEIATALGTFRPPVVGTENLVFIDTLDVLADYVVNRPEFTISGVPPITSGRGENDNTVLSTTDGISLS